MAFLRAKTWTEWLSEPPSNQSLDSISDWGPEGMRGEFHEGLVEMRELRLHLSFRWLPGHDLEIDRSQTITIQYKTIQSIMS